MFAVDRYFYLILVVNEINSVKFIRSKTNPSKIIIITVLGTALSPTPVPPKAVTKTTVNPDDLGTTIVSTNNTYFVIMIEQI